MDKFGFFKLLNSFLTPTEPKNDSSDGKSDALSNLLSSFNEQNINKNDGQNSQTKTQVQQPTPTPQKPLQASMLSVMSSHDDFIKRVKSKNYSPNGK